MGEIPTFTVFCGKFVDCSVMKIHKTRFGRAALLERLAEQAI